MKYLNRLSEEDERGRFLHLIRPLLHADLEPPGTTQRSQRLSSGSGLTIRMVAGFAGIAEGRDILVAKACNHPNLLVIPFSLEIMHAGA
jgi:hypothetical protein